MYPKKTIVITGSTRGIGFGLADSFLNVGSNVVINGRSENRTRESLERLQLRYGVERVTGCSGDCTSYDDMQKLWDYAVTRFGHVDIWVNNAGIGQMHSPLWEIAPEEMGAIISTNVLGVLYASTVALKGMKAQGQGAIYAMEGLGSDGRIIPGVSIYGASKYAVKYIVDALVKESRHSPIQIGALRPGMVVTEMITGPYENKPEEWNKVKKIFSLLSDRVETVTPWLVKKMLTNKKTGVRFSWLTPTRLLCRFVASPFVKRNPFRR